MKVSIEKPGTPEEVLDYLAHYGKKGMRWGVRNAYKTRVAKSAARNRRVGEGKGSFVDKVKTHSTTSTLDIIKGRGGLKKAALGRAQRGEAHLQRLDTGKATTVDLLKAYGGLRYSDMVKGNLKKRSD